ncbi:synaptonemal complex central element protein 2 isoform X3 [Choloepus didactylus]|uniref:synaptonemal complex central element protein 2 isoform X3 n=1 Tax=Choloepus didactylus TaxID=27675 RepID=UPI0018A0E35C|nr:synaptonemal complex central element protein 2 isoform X3 [Choloepus didactylus]
MERQGVDMSHAESKDHELQPLGDGKDHLQGEDNREDEAGRGPVSIDILKKRAQELIENINESRQKDHALMTNFRDSLKIKVSDLAEKLEERMYQLYNHHNQIIQEKLQEFTQKMGKITHLETELKQVCHSVETVYKDLCVQHEVREWGPWGRGAGAVKLRVGCGQKPNPTGVAVNESPRVSFGLPCHVVCLH